MPKKKKSGKKSGKLSKMTEEERAKWMEDQKLAEEKLKRDKEELLAQFLKNKLTKEEKMSKFNENKLNQQWRHYMREAKSTELKKELEILSQTFERVVDRKESVIKALGKDLEEAEEQKAMVFRRHIQTVDYLIGLLNKMMALLHQLFLDEQGSLMEEFDSEKEMLIRRHDEMATRLQDVMFAMEQSFYEKETELKAEFQSINDEIKNKSLEEKHGLRIHLESIVEDLWSQFTIALKNYQEATEERKKAYEELKARDEKSAEEIDMQMRKLQRITDNIGALRCKLQLSSREGEDRNTRLKEERDIMAVHFQGLKAQLSKLRGSERERLTRLTMMADAAEKELNAKCSRSERILKFAEMCRGLETEEEKVLPFYASTLTKEEQEDVNVAVAEPPKEALAKVMYDYVSLENFWKRYNKALLDKAALSKEKSTLLDQNQQLRLLLKQYLDGISVNDEILTQANPLFIVNHNSSVKMNVPLMDRRVARQFPAPCPPVVEGAHHVSSKSRRT